MRYLKIFLMSILFVLLCSCPAYASTSIDEYSFPDFKDMITNEDGSEKYYHILCFGTANNDVVDSLTFDLYVFDEGSDLPYAQAWSSAYGYYFDTTASNFLNRNLSWKKYNFTHGVHSDWTLGTGDSNIIMFGPANRKDELSADISTVYSNYDMCLGESECFFSQARTISGAIIPMKNLILSQIVDCPAYLVPCLIGLVVGLIAFRKAWNLLRVQLLT